MKKEGNIEITEIFMAKEGRNGWDNCFHGTIRRDHDENGDPIVYGKIFVNDRIIEASGKDQWELGEKLDELVFFELNHSDFLSIGIID